jgi:HAMP domain-containing protein
MEYLFMFVILFGAYVLFRISSWILGTVIKLAFVAAFIALGVLAMSSTVGLI